MRRSTSLLLVGSAATLLAFVAVVTRVDGLPKPVILGWLGICAVSFVLAYGAVIVEERGIREEIDKS